MTDASAVDRSEGKALTGTPAVLFPVYAQRWSLANGTRLLPAARRRPGRRLVRRFRARRGAEPRWMRYGRSATSSNDGCGTCSTSSAPRPRPEPNRASGRGRVQ
jgi:hypothetical protein